MGTAQPGYVCRTAHRAVWRTPTLLGAISLNGWVASMTMEAPTDGETTTGIGPFDRLVEQVMTRPPYKDARRVFWIVDNGSSHRSEASATRLKQRFPRLTLVHGPVHASWLNQIEIYFPIIQRKVLNPNHFANLGQLAERLPDFQYYRETTAKPFEWKFTKADLAKLLTKISAHEKLA